MEVHPDHLFPIPEETLTRFNAKCPSIHALVLFIPDRDRAAKTFAEPPAGGGTGSSAPARLLA
jgi:hypothetical protein